MKRNKFSLSHTKLASANMGLLYPIALFEVLPGDTIQQATSLLLRCSPLLAPVMHPVDVRVHHWYTPYRLLWDKWEDFITGGPDGMDASVYPTRSFAANPVPVGGLSDFFGIPPGFAGTTNALPYRAYYKIWNEFYRDQDLQTKLPEVKTSGDDTIVYQIQNINWEKDYFTASRPWEQKGPAVSVPIVGGGGQAPVKTGGITVTGPQAAMTMSTTSGGTPAAGAYGSGPTGGAAVGIGGTGSALSSAVYPSNLYADIAGTTGNVRITALREAFAIQRYEEARARYGSRYTEYLRYLGVRSSDARLQRPEYLGGGRQTIQFSEVLQTAEGTSPVGEMRGHGIAGMRSNRYRRFFEEHGCVISLLSIRPKAIYHQGIDRIWSRRTKEDFWTKELEHIGQQEILNQEIHAGHATPLGTFGYTDRYQEYRQAFSVVSGEFRSLLNYWHLARDFVTPPALNSDFVKCVPTERVFSVPSKDVMYLMMRHSIQARRLVSRSTHSHVF